MSAVTNTLREICTAYLLETKWLLVPSQRVGHQWIERLVRNGTPAVNLRPTTVIRFALDLVGSELAKEGLTYADRDVGSLIIDAAWGRLPADGYLGRLRPSTELSSIVFESLMALRLSGAKPGKLDGSQIESAAKAKDIQSLFHAYEDFLKNHRLVDRADILRRAIARLRGNVRSLDDRALILEPEGFRAGGMEREFLDSIPSRRRMTIAHPLTKADAECSDIDLLAHIGKKATGDVPQPRHDQSVLFFRAIGEINEVREVLRRCLGDSKRLDDVEILHTDADTYIPLIFATARRYFSDQGRPEGIPVTFAEGIPISLSRPGRALIAWLRWIEEDHSQRLFVDMIGEGLLQFEDDDDLSYSYLAQILRPIAIGVGANNYLRKINEQLESLEKTRFGMFDVNEDNEGEAAAHGRRARWLKLMRSLLKRLLPLSKAVTSESGRSVLDAAEQFLSKCARSVSELDKHALQFLNEQIKSRKELLERLHIKVDLRKWLAMLPLQSRVLGSRPRPGYLHVAHIGSGGQSGRHNTFVVGLDDARFPGAALQDPILLDSERSQLSKDLSTSGTRLHLKLEEFANTLSRLRGHLTLSWPCVNLTDDRERFASSTLLAAYRLVSGRSDADLETLNREVGQPCSFAPISAEMALDESERWLWRLSHPDVRGTGQQALVEGCYPHLARGSLAMQQRAAGFNQFNGYVRQAGMDINPFSAEGMVVSASALETAGRCPLAFFFRKVLKLTPPEELDVDLDRWINPWQFGLLLHDTFREFMSEVRELGRPPEFERDQNRLAQILDEAVQKWRNKVPPPNENAFRMQQAQLIRTARIFLEAEEEYCRTVQPRFLEVAVGLPPVAGGTPLDRGEPTTLDLESNRSIHALGQVDRVDELGPGRYSILDYKVGSGYGYDRVKPFRQGRRVQSILYLRMIETIMREKLDPSARVEQFGYFFPGVRAHGLRIHWDAAVLAPGLAILDRLCSTIAAGAFVATNNKDDCSYCDYRTICRDVDRVTAQSKVLLERDDLIPLKAFQELRRG
jgi:PD-(D/E)XK nuclease superfamily